MSSFTIGTAGHVDHGKSALVEALTGTHPDRLVEEQARGMTIDLGFTFMPLSGGGEAPIIDVPGHERFLKTMVAGVSGINLALLIVAADQGVAPQTVEHLGALRFMGVGNGIIVLTKKDLVDEEWLLLVEEEIRELVRGSFLEQAPCVNVSAYTGDGIPELKGLIETTLNGLTLPNSSGRFRLPIDRVFTLKGFGTVVAGTIASGRVSLEDGLELLPSCTPVRVRGMQTHNEAVQTATVGQRTALNLTNIKVSDVERGYELSYPGYFLPTLIIDAFLETLGTLGAPIKNGSRIRLHKGTSETIGRVFLLDQEELRPGESGYVQFRLESPVVAERTERFIIRGFSSLRLLGGGRLIDIYAQKHRRFRESILNRLIRLTGAEPRILVEDALCNAHGPWAMSQPDLARETSLAAPVILETLERMEQSGDIVTVGPWIIHRRRLEQLRGDILAQLSELHKSLRLRQAIPRDSVRSRLPVTPPDVLYEVAIRDLIASGEITSFGPNLALRGHTVKLSPQEAEVVAIIDRLGEQPGVEALSLSGLAQHLPEGRVDIFKGMLGYLLDRGLLVEYATGTYLHPAVLERIKGKLVAFLEVHGTVRATEWREYLGISRSDATALLDYFYDIGVTRREAGTHTLERASNKPAV